MKTICIITNKYPNVYEPNVLVFVQQLVWEMADQGIDCTVICPMPVNIHPKYFNLPYHTIEYTEKNNKINVLRPKYFSLGQTEILGINPAKFSTKSFECCVKKAIINNKLKPDVLYAHFITPAGIAAVRVGRSLNIPTFMAHGEATTMTIDDFGGAIDVSNELKYLNGTIAVSSHNKKMLLDNNIVCEEKIKIFPNGFNPLRFHKMDKWKARKKFGFDTNDFIVGFVGSFDNRKGILRLQEAVDSFGGRVKFACAGKGKLMPSSANCIYAKPVNHSNLINFYNACDIFVLPTQMEGCCNAIVEAVACGLPIVSSDRLFNKEILDETNALLIDPDNVNEIKVAISKLYSDKGLREKKAMGSLKMSQNLTIEKRTKRIINYIEESINSRKGI